MNNFKSYYMIAVDSYSLRYTGTLKNFTFAFNLLNPTLKSIINLSIHWITVKACKWETTKKLFSSSDIKMWKVLEDRVFFSIL